MKLLFCALVVAFFPSITQAQGPTAIGAVDPFQWLEDIDAPRSMAWVEGQNARSAKRLESDPRYETFHAQARAIFTAEDRIATPHFRAGGSDHLWQAAQ